MFAAFRAQSANPRVREWVAVIVFALAAFELVLDFRILPPTAIDWIFSFDSDTAQYYLAFAYFRNAAWHWPLTNMETMLHPVGASFMQADGLPLLAIPAKALRALLPADFQFYGFWLFSCVILGAVFAKLVLERLLTNRALVLAGIAIITLAPPFVGRFPHVHLAAHWLVLAAFWTVLEARALPKKRIWLFSTMSLFVQPYMFVIVSGVLVGACWVHRRGYRELAVCVSVWLLLVALAAWSLGYFGLERSVAGQAERYHADLTTFVSAQRTSNIVPDLPLGGDFKSVLGGHAEGYAYLGLGGILLLAALVATLVAPLFSRGAVRRLDPTWRVLGILCLLMAAFATSPSPFLFGHRLNGIPMLTEWLAPLEARFRSAGRFIWPLFYYVLLFGLQAAEGWLTRVKMARVGLVAALVLVGAQAADMGPWLSAQGQARAVTNPRRLGDIPPAVRARFTEATRFLVFDPPILRARCAGRGRRWGNRFGYYPLAVFGARHHLVADTDFCASSRLTSAQIHAVCEYSQKLGRSSHLPADVLLIEPEDVYFDE